jgi:hypothetical protein
VLRHLREQRVLMLAAVSTAGEDALLDALDEATTAQLIRAGGLGSNAATPGDDAFAFTHDKIRGVLHEDLNPIRRRCLHQRVGETLERLDQVVAHPQPRATPPEPFLGPRPGWPRHVAPAMGPGARAAGQPG